MAKKYIGTWVPRAISWSDDLNWTEKGILAIVEGLEGETGCYASNAFFSRIIGVGERQVTNYISRLRERGLLLCRMLPGDKRRLWVSPAVMSREHPDVLPGREPFSIQPCERPALSPTPTSAADEARELPCAPASAAALTASGSEDTGAGDGEQSAASGVQPATSGWQSATPGWQSATLGWQSTTTSGTKTTLGGTKTTLGGQSATYPTKDTSGGGGRSVQGRGEETFHTPRKQASTNSIVREQTHRIPNTIMKEEGRTGVGRADTDLQLAGILEFVTAKTFNLWWDSVNGMSHLLRDRDGLAEIKEGLSSLAAQGYDLEVVLPEAAHRGWPYPWSLSSLKLPGQTNPGPGRARAA